MSYMSIFHDLLFWKYLMNFICIISVDAVFPFISQLAFLEMSAALHMNYMVHVSQ